MLQVGLGRFFFFFTDGCWGRCIGNTSYDANPFALHRIFRPCQEILSTIRNFDGHDDGFSDVIQGDPQCLPDQAYCSRHIAPNAGGFGGYTPSPIHAHQLLSTNEFHHLDGHGDNLQPGVNPTGLNFAEPQFVLNDVCTPTFSNGQGNKSSLDINVNGYGFAQLPSCTNGVFAPAIIAGHGNDSQLGWNTNGFDFNQPEFHPNCVFTPIISGHGQESYLGVNADGSGFSQPQLHANSVFTPPIITGHGSESWLGVNANGSGFTQPQSHANGVFTPTPSTLSTIVDAQGVFNGGEFANVNGGFDGLSPTFNARGFNHGNNHLPTSRAYSSNNDGNSLLTMGVHSYGYENNSLPPGNSAYGSGFITPPQVTNGMITPANPGFLAATPFASPENSDPAEPPATGPKSRSTCSVCKKTYARSSDLKRHAAKHRPGLREFSCPATVCPYKGNKGFTRKDKMKDHVKNMHPEIDARSL